jgi:protein involved in polysaccharide export with SLBB domain
MFQNMTPEQQRSILEAMGRGSNGTSTGVTRTDRALQFPQVVQPRRDEADREDEDTVNPLTGQKREPRLKADDTILLSLQIRDFEAPDPDEVPGQTSQSWDPNTPASLDLLTPAQRQQYQQMQQMQQMQRTGGANQPSQQNNQFRKPIIRTDNERKRIEETRDRIERRNPYRLDELGVLNIPELGPIALAGLTVEQAQQRLNADANLKEFRARIVRLPLKRTGTEALNPFGYDLFAGYASTFAPATDVPVPADYVIGPGDTINAQLVGNTKGNYSLVVGRDGQINFPELGPIAVGGMHFDQLRTSLEKRVREQMIGTQLSVSMGELRSIRVFVLGDAAQPGSYTVSGLSTITNALYVSGGIKRIGSLRNIELKRNGQTVVKLDLYDLLLKGDTHADVRLMPGDAVFVPPVGSQVSLVGEVRRPAMYEIKGETTAAELVALGGGLTSQADGTLATLERVDQQRQRVTVNVNLANASGSAARLRMGDVLRVPGIRPSLEDSVTLSGYVYRPGQFQYHKGMRLSEVLPSVDELRPNGDQHYVLIRRELPPDRRVQVFSADLAKAVTQPGSASDIELQPRDRIYAFDVESGRDQVIEPLLRDMRTQSQFDQPTQQVRVGGKVKVPGQYPLEPGMHVSDLIRAGGSLGEAAYGTQAELTRYTVEGGEARESELIKVDLNKLRAGDRSADIQLQPFDYLVIKEIPKWAAEEEVEVRGEVKFPGIYPIHRGETLRSVVERAGGLTDLAFARGSVFTRKELKERERKQIETLAGRMQSDLAQLSLSVAQETGKDASSALSVGNSLMANLRNAEPVGRLVINLNRVIVSKPGGESDVVLKDGDRLIVPRVSQEVTVIGEVQSTTSHLYDTNLSREDYIQMSGGLTQRGDKKHIYVVHADGSVVARSSKAWFSQSSDEIKPGDTIVVPLDAERMRPLPMWQSITTIIYNLAVAAAAIHGF